MDEPFGAVDPITRARLQHELRRLHREVGKTILFVTHDIDEAIGLGDRIAIFREGGILAQSDTPDRILAAPADEFVERFIGEDRALRRLALRRLGDVELAHEPVAGAVSLPATMTVRNALSLMLDTGAAAVAVTGDDGAELGVLRLEQIRALLA
jgi:osmoprotectant transport system ATP-binding protein